MIITLTIIVISGFMMPMHYSSSFYKANNITTGTNNTYPIYLSNVSKGNGTYQQLITINNYYKYGINDNGSNIEFFDSLNYTHLYAWIQSINSTSMKVWIKNYNNSSVIYMYILPMFDNLFSANGYLGEAPQLSSVYGEYFNAVKVFGNGNAADFAGYHSAGTFYFDNYSFLGYNNVYIDNGIIVSNSSYSSSEFRSNNTYTAGINIAGIQWWNNDTGYAFYGFMNASFSLHYADGYGVDGGGFGLVLRNNSNYPVDVNGLDLINSTEVFKLTLPNLFNDSIITLNEIGYNSVSGNIPSGVVPKNVYISGWNVYGSHNYEYIVKYSVVADANFINFTMPYFTIGSLLYHSIDFKLIGSSTSFQWSISINGTIYNATSSNIYLNMTNGYYNIIVNLPSQYSAIANGVLKVNNANEIFRITVVSQNSNNFSNDIMYAIILASIIIAVALYFSRRN